MDISSTQVSRAAAELDEMLEAWRTRNLGCYRYVILNAQYEKVRQGGQVLDADIRAIFTAPDQDEAEHLLGKFLIRYEKTAPQLVAWAEEAIPEGFTVFALPASHRRKLRTTNLVERLNEEIRRRTRVARLFPNEAACLRLVSAILMEISEDWQNAGKRYVVFNTECAIDG